MQRNTSHLRILTGLPDNPKLHMLNGPVDTPLFRHLGSSSWHEMDAKLIKSFANFDQRLSFGMVLVAGAAAMWALGLCVSRIRRWGRREGWVEGA